MIKSFREQWRWLSNFQSVPVVFDHVVYPSVENAYQAAKTTDPDQRRVFEVCSAYQAKQFGKRMTLRPDWEDIRLELMRDLCRQKYHQEPYRRKLLDTYDWLLQEGNWWGDTFWGVCNGEGQNHLGRIIMTIRLELRRGYEANS